MRLVRLQLRGSCPFWILNPIRLHKDKETSPLIDVDLLTDREKDIINKSVRAKDIWLLNSEGNRINGTLEYIGMSMTQSVSTDDVLIEEESMPEIVSVTADDPEEEEDEDDEYIIDPKYFEDARILLKKHHSTIKKTIAALEIEDENLMLIHACLHEETIGKQRAGIILALQKKIMEF